MSSALIIDKEENTILADGSAEGAPEDVADELGRYIRLTRLQFRRLYEIIVGAGGGVAVIFVERTVKIVGATFGNERHLCARGASLVGIGIRGCDSELLDGVQCDWQDGSKSAALYLVVDINAIQRDVALVTASSIHGPASRINISINIGAIARIGNASLQCQQVWYVPPLKRQLLNLIFSKRISD